MNIRKKTLTLFGACMAILIMILDSKTAFWGASQGLNLCIYTVIPSLFPFFVFSQYLTSELTGLKIRMLRPVMNSCGVPEGGDSILIMGLVGGYPVGAQCIANAYQNAELSRNDANRMLGFCNNAGPAFIFGMMSSMFENPLVPWVLWIIHICSAILVGMILPKKSRSKITPNKTKAITLTDAVIRSIKAMAVVCCWVILFRILICFCSKWFLWILPVTYQAIFTGALELVNGCQALRILNAEPLRFVLSACFLSFGGFCVYLQTISVIGELKSNVYLKGKLLQTYFSFVLSVMCSILLYHKISWMILAVLVILVIAFIVIYYMIFSNSRKKEVAFT